MQVPEISCCSLLSSRGHWSGRERKGHHARQEGTSNRKLYTEWWCLCSSTERAEYLTAHQKPGSSQVTGFPPSSPCGNQQHSCLPRAGTKAELMSAGLEEHLDGDRTEDLCGAKLIIYSPAWFVIESIKHLYFNTTRVSWNFTDLPGKKMMSGGNKNSVGFYHLTSTASRVFLDRKRGLRMGFSGFLVGFWLVGLVEVWSTGGGLWVFVCFAVGDFFNWTIK